MSDQDEQHASYSIHRRGPGPLSSGEAGEDAAPDAAGPVEEIDPLASILSPIAIPPPRPDREFESAAGRILLSGDDLIDSVFRALPPSQGACSAVDSPASALRSQPAGEPDILGHRDNFGSDEIFRAIHPPFFATHASPELALDRLDAEPRIPHFGHLCIVAAIAFLGFAAAAVAVQGAFHFHLWGVATLEKAATDIRYTLASMSVLYVVSLAIAWLVLPRMWHRPLSQGLQWNADAAVRHRYKLLAAAGFCFVLAMADEAIFPSPSGAPIDKMFSNSSAAWLLFAFGVTAAPFFEEMAFRGFLLPSFCTAVDWVVEKRMGKPAPPLGPNGHPRWSLPAMAAGSLLTSLPFAWMHAEQIAHSFGPLVLLYCVSLVLCIVRLATRSLAASTLVHAAYNFILFSFMLVGTGGFKHLDKM